MEPSTCHKRFRETILLVDDVPANLDVLTSTLEPEGYEILAASSGMEALRIAAKGRPDLILLDIMMPEMDGWETCRRLKQDERTRDTPILFITARAEMQSMVEGFRSGGVDYVVKPFHAEEVVSRVATHLRINRLTRELRERNQALERRTTELNAEMERRQQAESALQDADTKLAAFSDLEASRGNLAAMIGHSPPLRGIIEEIRRLHQFPNTSVLILGESGTGKELVARAIHCESARSKAPFVAINCVAIPAELAESVLFGHLKGSFTGATADRKGCFALADGGTLFLDEIGDMPAAMQVKLLRVLEDGQVTPVGGMQPKKVDVRIIAATNADLEARITAGSFRQDLFFRLARYTLVTPPLRERTEDIPILAAHFLHGFAAEMGRKAPPLRPEALEILKRHCFRGNIRELKNILERALIDSEGHIIEPPHLHLPIAPSNPASALRAARKENSASLPLNLSDAEDVLIQRALDETNGNIAEAARLLGVHRTRIYRRLAHESALPQS